jgi:hypothetical protein
VSSVREALHQGATAEATAQSRSAGRAARGRCTSRSGGFAQYLASGAPWASRARSTGAHVHAGAPPPSAISWRPAHSWVRTTARACATYLLVAALWTLRLLECSHLLMSCMTASLSLRCVTAAASCPCYKRPCTVVTNAVTCLAVPVLPNSQQVTQVR